MEKILRAVEKIIPKKIYRFGQPFYHVTMAFLSAVYYRFPSRKIRVIAVTGTKGKSSTVELVNAILEQAGYKTALSNTIRFKIGKESTPNMYKMSMPGRGFMQGFLRHAVNAHCDFAVVEMTSQGSLLSRHRFIDIDTFVVTNISPEHIEAHGSFENYVASKLAIGTQFENSPRKALFTSKKILVVNKDEPELKKFIDLKADTKILYCLGDLKPYSLLSNGVEFTYDCIQVTSHLAGLFNIYNILAAIKTAEALGVAPDKIITAIRTFKGIKGRVEKIQEGQDFTVVIDYAHTVDSLQKLYQIFRHDPRASRTNKMIAVLGGTGGGRDKAKRKDMGALAAHYCDTVILTNEDPYDEDPNQIIEDVKRGVLQAGTTPTVIVDRREAIAKAISLAKTGDIILITGKGTDPYIMGAHGHHMPWSDARIAREELRKLSTLNKKA